MGAYHTHTFLVYIAKVHTRHRRIQFSSRNCPQCWRLKYFYCPKKWWQTLKKHLCKINTVLSILYTILSTRFYDHSNRLVNNSQWVILKYSRTTYSVRLPIANIIRNRYLCMNYEALECALSYSKNVVIFFVKLLSLFRYKWV